MRYAFAAQIRMFRALEKFRRRHDVGDGVVWIGLVCFFGVHLSASPSLMTATAQTPDT